MARTVVVNTTPDFKTTILPPDRFKTDIEGESPGRVFIGGKPTIRSFRATPFKVRFTTTNVDSYSETNPAPIGIAIIEYSNYVL